MEIRRRLAVGRGLREIARALSCWRDTPAALLIQITGESYRGVKGCKLARKKKEA